MDVNLLKEVANYIGATDIEKEISFLERKNRMDCPLVLPLMGEFSAGKTTLINALTDSKELETSTKPTTATIYEVHFGCESCSAEVYNRDGSVVNIDSISSLHNADLADAAVVEVYDTSTQVPSSIVLVDTPGLSSHDVRHKQALVDFIPNADGIILVADVNTGGLTRSLTEFIKTMELSKRRIYLVLTYCDTKSAADIASQKKYIESNNGIPQRSIAAVAAKDGKVSELLSLLDTIQKDKSQIIEQVNAQRFINIATELKERIAKLKKAGDSDEELEDAIFEQESKLKSLNRSIDKLIDSLSDDIQDMSRQAERKFEDTISGRLEELTGNRSSDFDTEAASIVNNTSSMVVSGLCAQIQEVLRVHASSSAARQDGVVFGSLNNVDLGKFEVEGLSYNLNLNEMGHEFDGKIAVGLKIAAAAAAVVVAAPVLAGGVGAVGAAEAGAVGAAETGGMVAEYGIADLAVDATQTALILKNRNANAQNQPAPSEQPNRREQMQQKYEEYEQQDQQIGEKLGFKGGIVESMVGLVTDKTMGKPQRRRAVHEYVDSTLMPSFKAELQRNVNSLLNEIRISLQEDSAEVLHSVRASLQSLKEEKNSKDSDFRARMKQLDQYSQMLISIS